MKRIIILSFVLTLIAFYCPAQKTVGPENWFNHENNIETEKIFHYTWDNKANSGFSQLCVIFSRHGAH